MALSPKEWFDLLEQRFTADTRVRWEDTKERPHDPRPRNQILDTLWSYYCGDAPLPQIAPEYQDIFRDLMRKSRSNFAEMCVSAVVSRMELQGVATKGDKDANGDDTANEIMEESGFAAQFKDIEVFKSALGESFGMVVPPPTAAKVFGALPTIHAIDPRRCVGIPDPYNPVRLRAALIKEWDIETKAEVRHLFLPGKKWTLKKNPNGQWDEPTDANVIEKVTGIDDLGGIPIVQFQNPLGQGEYEAHLDVLDRLIDITLQSLVLMKFQAFKPMAAIGDEPEDDEYDDESTFDDEEAASEPTQLISDGSPKQVKDWNDVFQAGPGAVWKLPANWQIWQGQAGDVTGIINAKRDTQKEFAAVSHTPLYLITPDDANGSAEGAGLLREALTSKVRDRRARDQVSTKLLWRIAFAMAGKKVKATDILLLWGPMEFKSLAEKGSASAQAATVLSRQQILADIWEYPPEVIAEVMRQLDAQKLQDAITAQLAAPPPAPNNQNQNSNPQQPSGPQPPGDVNPGDAASNAA